MKSSYLLVVVSATLLCVSPLSAQDDKPANDENTAKGFHGRGDLLAKTLVFSEEITRITERRTQEGLPDYAAAINKHFGNGVTADQNGAVALYEAFGPAPEGTRLSDRFFELLDMPVPPDDGQYFQDFGADLPVEERRAANDKYSDSWQRPWAAADFPQLA